MANEVFEQTEDGVTFDIYIVPGAKKDAFMGLVDGLKCKQLKIAVCARPIEGQANEALIRFLSEQLKTAKSNIVIISGIRSRNKKVLIRNHRIADMPDVITAVD
ncbi:MAG: DUF167 domain-containing protein [Holosporales bacterium]|nr:DUF167 domain-containing protein [Holosporales bacterium]